MNYADIDKEGSDEYDEDDVLEWENADGTIEKSEDTKLSNDKKKNKPDTSEENETEKLKEQEKQQTIPLHFVESQEKVNVFHFSFQLFNFIFILLVSIFCVLFRFLRELLPFVNERLKHVVLFPMFLLPNMLKKVHNRPCSLSSPSVKHTTMSSSSNTK